MIEINIVSTELRPTREDIQAAINKLNPVIQASNVFATQATGLGFSILNNNYGFAFLVSGLYCRTDAATKNIISNMVLGLLTDAELESTYIVHSINVNALADDIHIEMVAPAPKSFNSIVLDYLKIDRYPERFNCNIAQDIMDTCIYTRVGKKISYDEQTLFYWLSQQSSLLDPFKKIEITAGDIVEDLELQYELDAFMTPHKLKYLRLKYKLPDTSADSLHTALRRAAALGYIEDLQYLITVVDDINNQDNNPQGLKTALHWACKNKKEQCVIALLTAGAGFSKQDADKKTAFDLAPAEFKRHFTLIDSTEAISARAAYLSYQLTCIVKLILNDINTVPKVSHGLFAGKYPRDIRAIASAYKKVQNSVISESIKNLMDLSMQMFGANHPMTYHATKAYHLAICLEGSDVKASMDEFDLVFKGQRR